jgi:hypothetical protein
MSKFGTNKNRRWKRISLRTLLLLMSAACFALGWFSIRLRDAARQRAATQAIDSLGGNVNLDFRYNFPKVNENENPFTSEIKAGWPDWMRRLLGDDFLFQIDEVRLWDKEVLDDDDLVPLENIGRLKALNLQRSSVTDAGFQHAKYLKGLTSPTRQIRRS